MVLLRSATHTPIYPVAGSVFRSVVDRRLLGQLSCQPNQGPKGYLARAEAEGSGMFAEELAGRFGRAHPAARPDGSPRVLGCLGACLVLVLGACLGVNPSGKSSPQPTPPLSHTPLFSQSVPHSAHDTHTPSAPTRTHTLPPTLPHSGNRHTLPPFHGPLSHASRPRPSTPPPGTFLTPPGLPAARPCPGRPHRCLYNTRIPGLSSQDPIIPTLH